MSQLPAGRPQRSSMMTRFLTMFALVMAGETIFGLPYVAARVFRPTLLDVFGITNLQLGTAFSLYGVVAMLAYFPGGALADRFSARGMMAMALLRFCARRRLLRDSAGPLWPQGAVRLLGIDDDPAVLGVDDPCHPRLG
jgi:MFS family permease